MRGKSKQIGMKAMKKAGVGGRGIQGLDFQRPHLTAMGPPGGFKYSSTLCLFL